MPAALRYRGLYPACTWVKATHRQLTYSLGRRTFQVWAAVLATVVCTQSSVSETG